MCWKIMKAAQNKKVKSQMKCVVTDLEAVVGELSGVTKDLRSLLVQIDRVTYALLQGCEHGLRSPELEEATYKSLVPKPTEVDFLNNFSGYSLSNIAHTSQTTRAPVQETDFPVNEPFITRRENREAVKEKDKRSTCSASTSEPIYVRKPAILKYNHKSTVIRNDLQTRKAKYVGVFSDNHCVGIQQRKLLDKLKSREKPVSEKVSLRASGSKQMPRKISDRGQISREKLKSDREPLCRLDSEKSDSQPIEQPSHTTQCSKEICKCLNATNCDSTCQTMQAHCESSAANTSDSLRQSKCEQASTRATPQWRSRLQGNICDMDSIESTDGSMSASGYRSSDSEQENRSTPLFSSPMHIPVALERMDSGRGSPLQGFEANYNRTINTWTTYALVHIDNASEDGATALQQNSEDGEDIDDDDDDDSEETHPEPKGLDIGVVI